MAAEEFILIHCPVGGEATVHFVTGTDSDYYDKMVELMGECPMGRDFGDCDFSDNTYMYVKVGPLVFNPVATMLVRYFRGRRLPSILLNQNLCCNDTVIMVRGATRHKVKGAIEFLNELQHLYETVPNFMACGNTFAEACKDFLDSYGSALKSKITVEELADFYGVQ